ncbi:unnamed protein product [Protopolystoma xenopodis]|uniref:Uncharacterized protein n=1 Tax=Protopolystoma xenopodis TaxID=117903 RepID=A0A3S5BSI6_9PLAT|nr:unnamed protein product [Protopolystoma xenopodis]
MSRPAWRTRVLLSLIPFRVEVLGEEIRRSVPPEDDGRFLLTSCRLAYWNIHADAVSERIFFDSGEKGLSFRPSYDGHHPSEVTTNFKLTRVFSCQDTSSHQIASSSCAQSVSSVCTDARNELYRRLFDQLLLARPSRSSITLVNVMWVGQRHSRCGQNWLHFRSTHVTMCPLLGQQSYNTGPRSRPPGANGGVCLRGCMCQLGLSNKPHC